MSRRGHFSYVKLGVASHGFPLVADTQFLLAVAPYDFHRIRTDGKSRGDRFAGSPPFRPYHVHHPICPLPRIAQLVHLHGSHSGVEDLVEFSIVSDSWGDALDARGCEDVGAREARRDKAALDSERGDFFAQTVHHA